jgi:zinc and cadmium transporter
MSIEALLAIYCLMIVIASLLGGSLPSLLRLTHVRMQLMMSLVSGIMLGIAMLHMLPQAAENLDSMTRVAGSMLAGLLVMFFLLRVFHVHSHGELDHAACGHEGCDHDHRHEEVTTGGHELNWVGLFVGLAIHTLLDGVALAASTVADASHHTQDIALYGLGTFLAVVLHKPLDALAITSLMHTGGWTSRSQAVVNSCYALMCPLGAIMFWYGVSQFAVGQNALVGYALAFSAGFFLCIALGDLLPEVQFHSHDRWKLSFALLAGVAIAYGIEMTHSHVHPPDAPHNHPHTHRPLAHDHPHE